MKKNKNKRILIIIILIVIICCGIFFYLTKFKKNALIDINTCTKNKVNNFNCVNSGVYILSSESKKYTPLENLFTSVGFDVASGDFSKFLKIKDSNFILILPEEEVNNLNEFEINTLKFKIKKGQKIITNGNNKLCNFLGIDVENEKLPIKKYIWENHPEEFIKIKKGVNAYSFKYTNDYKLLAHHGNSKKTIAVSGSLGKGKFIYSAIPIAPSKGNSYEYYPFLMEAIESDLKIKPVFKTNDGAIYIDIGFHIDEEPSNLADKVKKWGFNQANVGIWSLNNETEDYYKKFIGECHKRNIKVFAWFELPMVNKEFWNEHPEWREKTATGKDAHIDWRYLMAMEDPDCFKKIQEYVKNTMIKFDWDGIDIAEIYFESPVHGLKIPNKFTPMHDSYVENFKNEYGINPKEIVNPLSKNYWIINPKTKDMIIESRVNLITSLHRKMLDLCKDIKNEKPYLEVIVTMIDSLSDDRMRETIGLDANEIIKLQEKYGFTIQVEDPYTLWKLGPGRYKVIGENYSKLINNGKLNIDINIVKRGPNVYPTSKQRGLELYQLVHNASKHTDKVIIYALSTLESNDMNMFPYAYYHDINVNELEKDKYIFDSNKKFTWDINTDGKTIYLDGKKWPIYSKNNIIIPKGKHTVSLVNETDKPSEGLRIEEINCHILSAEKSNELVNLSYNSDGRCFITVNKKPSLITLDDKNIKPKISELNGKYTIFLPEGKHNLNIKK